jgi:hypothetical protein
MNRRRRATYESELVVDGNYLASAEIEHRRNQIAVSSTYVQPHATDRFGTRIHSG